VQSVHGSDHNAALLDGLVLTSQVVSTQVTTTGYGGVVLWHHDDSWISVVAYPSWTGIVVAEFKNGQIALSPLEHRTEGDRWYDLRVEANSSTGELAVYLNNSFLFNYSSTVPRSGLTGVISGNAAGYFDNFQVTSNDIAAVPEHASLALWSLGALGCAVVGYRRRKGFGPL
jgi:hypothetical protein